MISGYPIWVVLLIGCGVFCASFVDAIGGGGGIIEMAGDEEGAGTDAEMREYLDKKSLAVRWGLYILLFTAVLLFGIYGPSYDPAVFIYREF